MATLAQSSLFVGLGMNLTIPAIVIRDLYNEANSEFSISMTEASWYGEYISSISGAKRKTQKKIPVNVYQSLWSDGKTLRTAKQIQLVQCLKLSNTIIIFIIINTVQFCKRRLIL